MISLWLVVSKIRTLHVTNTLSYFWEIQTTKFAVLDKSIPYQVFVGALGVFCLLSLISALFSGEGIGNVILRLLLGGAAVW